MAKAAPQKPTDPARFCLIVMEAELPSGGDLGQVIHAIQNAARPTVTTRQTPRPSRALNGPAPNGTTKTTDADARLGVEEMEAIELDLDEEEAVAKAPRKARKVMGKSPDVVDLDLTGFVDFANEKTPKSRAERYLVIATWLKEQRNISAITADHVFTCYKAAKWPTNIPDFTATLRTLKHQKLMSQNEAGFIINHLGLARAEELNKE